MGRGWVRGAILMAWVATLTVACGDAEVTAVDAPQNEPVDVATAPPEASIRALTPTQYNNTIRDLLGMPSDPDRWPAPPAVAARISPIKREVAGLFGSGKTALPPWPWTFPPEVGVDHFEGMIDGQVPSPYLLDELQRAADHFASYALVSPIFFACDDWATLAPAAQADCGWSSVARFAQRAWRRSISEAEAARLRGFWMDNLNAGPVDEAIALTVAGVLQSPAFLYFPEVGEPTQSDAVPLNDWEMASRLSYFLWNSMPDAALFQAAARGQLSSAEQVAGQARRMLRDPRARSAVVHFHHQWLGTDAVMTISPARRAYGPLYGISPAPALDTTDDGQWPSILGPIRHSLRAETALFVENAIFDGEGTLEALLTSTEGYMSDATAPLYGAEVTPRDGPTLTTSIGVVIFSQGAKRDLVLRPINYPPDQRAGLLMLPSVLSVGAYPVHPAPILRGKRILERLACQDLGSPPPDAEAAAPPDATDVMATNRERTADATRPAACAGCHDSLNPPGFAFEHFDAMGRWRAEDNGLPVDASGSFALWSGETFAFSDGVDLGRQLSVSASIRACYALRWTRYATGIHLAPTDAGVDAILAGFRADDDVKSLLVSIVSSDVFRFRRTRGAP